MAVVYAPRVWETGTLTGSSPFNLPNVAASGGYKTFANSFTTGATICVCILDNVSFAWELSLYTYTSGSPGTLTRVTLLASSTGSAITFSGNNCSFTCEIPAPVVSGAGSSSSGLIPALNTSGFISNTMVAPQAFNTVITYNSGLTTTLSALTANTLVLCSVPSSTSGPRTITLPAAVGSLFNVTFVDTLGNSPANNYLIVAPSGSIIYNSNLNIANLTDPGAALTICDISSGNFGVVY